MKKRLRSGMGGITLTDMGKNDTGISFQVGMPWVHL